MAIESTHQKVGGKSTGTNAPLKKSGYASGPVPPSMVGTKPGLIRGGSRPKAYSGPNVARYRRS